MCALFGCCLSTSYPTVTVLGAKAAKSKPRGRMAAKVLANCANASLPPDPYPLSKREVKVRDYPEPLTRY